VGALGCHESLFRGDLTAPNAEVFVRAQIEGAIAAKRLTVDPDVSRYPDKSVACATTL
jgi:hypothetical protein